MMFGMNLWGSIYYTAAALMFTASSASTSQLIEVLAVHEALVDILSFCLCGAMGQLFIFLTIKEFGSLTSILVCTTRKFLSILLSVLLYRTPLTSRQWFGVVLVFFGVLVNSLHKKMRASKSSQKRAKAE